MSHSRYSHIDEIWEDFENCKNEREIKEVIDNIPYKFGEFYYEISEDGRIFKITNDYIEWGNFQTDTVDFDFPEKVKKKQMMKYYRKSEPNMQLERKNEIFNELLNYVSEHCRSEVDEYHAFRSIIGLSNEEIEELGISFSKDISEIENEMEEEYGR